MEVGVGSLSDDNGHDNIIDGDDEDGNDGWRVALGITMMCWNSSGFKRLRVMRAYQRGHTSLWFMHRV